MNSSRQITISALICALLLSSFPKFAAEDMDRDICIDLSSRLG
ncbi:MAG: hypothetical protein R2941_01850 [Desulfobacterales bacterium]